MYVIQERNVNGCFVIGMKALREYGNTYPSRNGEMIEMPTPVVSVYTEPTERVLFDHVRDANPYFHFFEALWMLVGHKDVAFPGSFAKQIAEYSDDGETLNGAYGDRWRYYFGYDQLVNIIIQLREDPMSRRVVLQMWDGRDDGLNDTSKDLPCNTVAYFALRDGYLNMTVSNRSNDIIWGCYGANAVHFSMLQEFIARAIGAEVGRYYQVSNSFHAYTGNPQWERIHETLQPGPVDPYSMGKVRPYAMMWPGTDCSDWMDQLELFFEAPDTFHTREGNDLFFKNVVSPMWLSHQAYKDGRMGQAREVLERIPPTVDWRVACYAWLDRRSKI